MTDLNHPVESTTDKVVVALYLYLTVLGGIYTLISTLETPTKSSQPVFLGLSLSRLLLFLFGLGITIFSSYLSIRFTFNRQWAISLLKETRYQFSRSRFFGTILIITILCLIWGLNFLAQIPGITEPVLSAYYLRLQPTIIWLTLLAGQTLILTLFLQIKFKREVSWKLNPWIYHFLLSSGLIILVILWVRWTGFGLNAVDEGIGWHSFGTPILFSQLLATMLISITLIFLLIRINSKENQNRATRSIKLDIAISLILWMSAFVLWMVQPLKSNWFVSEPRPPNYQYYPSSDASVYDITAINLSLGAGFRTRGSPFTLRPLYSTFLAGLHMLAGIDYESIIWIQVAVLSLIPVFLYLVGKRMHHPTTGFLLAVLFLVKEMNAIKLGDSISDAHVKLLMPFLPTTLGIMIFLWLFIRWLQKPEGRKSSALGSGGIIGLFMLIRPEIFVLLPIAVITALFQFRRKIQIWFKGLLWISLGVVLALLPWLWRNYKITGTIYIDSPHYRLDLLNKRYRDEPIGFSLPASTPLVLSIATPNPVDNTSINQQDTPSETKELGSTIPSSTLVAEGTQQVKPIQNSIIVEDASSDAPSIASSDDSIQGSTEGFASEVFSFIKENPTGTASFVANHFMNSMIQSIFVLPSSYPLTQSAIKFLGHSSLQSLWIDCCSLIDYERKFTFWPKWDGLLPGSSIIPISINLILISIGITVCWQRGKFIGLLPLLSLVSYCLINALVRNSGGRYILPVNWVSIFYFSVGFVHISLFAIYLFRNKQDEFISTNPYQSELESPNPIHQNKLGIFVSFFILLIAILLPLLEVLIPPKLDQDTLDRKLLTLTSSSQSLITSKELLFLTEFLNNSGEITQGLALYPRFHKPYQMGSVWRIYYDRPYSHMDFYLSYPGDRGVVLPIEDSPTIFDHASEALVIGCSQEEDIQALAVIIFDEDGMVDSILWRSPLPTDPICPLPIP